MGEDQNMESRPSSGWRYVWSRELDGEEDSWSIRELYYSPNNKFSYTGSTVSPFGDTPGELQANLFRMLSEEQSEYLDLREETPQLRTFTDGEKAEIASISFADLFDSYLAPVIDEERKEIVVSFRGDSDREEWVEGFSVEEAKAFAMSILKAVDTVSRRAEH